MYHFQDLPMTFLPLPFEIITVNLLLLVLHPSIAIIELLYPILSLLFSNSWTKLFTADLVFVLYIRHFLFFSGLLYSSLWL